MYSIEPTSSLISTQFPFAQNCDQTEMKFHIDTIPEFSSYSNITGRQLCYCLQCVKWIGFEKDRYESEKYDAILEDDIVRRQYKLLPCPPVPEKYLIREEQHYSANNKKIFSHFYPLHLESLNHYLYNGRNNFR